MTKTEYIKKIATTIVEKDNKQTQSFRPIDIYKKYDDPFEIAEFNTINEALLQMEKEGYIILEHPKTRPAEIAKIKIVSESVPALAEKYSLPTTKNTVKTARNILEPYRTSRCIQVREFVAEQIKQLDAGKAVKFVHSNDTQTLREVLCGAEAILRQEEDISLRELSIRVYKDSKVLENRLDQILSVINVDGTDKTMFLQQHHIFRNQTYVLIKGNVRIDFVNGDRITLVSGNNASIQLSREVVKNISSITTKKLLSIENLTSFENYQTTPDDGTILFLGGFSNNAQIDFIRKTNCPLMHFGDLDASGFLILHNLRKRTEKEVIAYKMDIETINRYAPFGKEMTDFNIKRLNEMLLSDKYSTAEKECFEKLLLLHKTIEQEIVGSDL